MVNAQQDKPDDFVIATGIQHSVRDFVNWTAGTLGINIEYKGKGEEEQAIVTSIEDQNSPIKKGDVIVRVDKKYYRPTEVESLLGDPSKAKNKLGWEPEITAKEMCKEMTLKDLDIARETALLNSNKG